MNSGTDDQIAAPNDPRTSRPRVGEPIHELRLIAALERDLWRLEQPGTGRSAFVVFEPEVGAGRPDAMILTASQRALERFESTGLRMPTPAAPRALLATDDGTLGLSQPYARTLRNRLLENGWTDAQRSRAADIVHDSLGLEAKMHDWRRALQQVVKFQVTVHRSAIMMPRDAALRVPEPYLTSYGIGLIEETAKGSKWLVRPVHRELPEYSRLWLLELLMRAREEGRAYTPSELRKRFNASSIAATRER